MGLCIKHYIIHAIKKGGKSSSDDSPSSEAAFSYKGNRKPGTCWIYQSGKCHNENCNRPHVCEWCGLDTHMGFQCRQKYNSNFSFKGGNSNRGRRTNNNNSNRVNQAANVSNNSACRSSTGASAGASRS